ncbi:AMP-binding protein [Lactobacillus mulieris]|uniref:AMP-binding protein n=1 Tax=Lactobacillus mulieris TaxID=2508708 RepID=UPI0022CDE781|nr:AMP-binding protein [Lactobacillus mulieris]MCZ9599399.1 AMP-binding protein [Lactobacillus mulieris]
MGDFETLKDAWDWRVKQTPDKLFIVYQQQHFTYQQVDNLASQTAYLLKKLGLRTGNIIGLQFEVDFENILYLIASIKLGLVINPLNPHFDSTEIQNLVDRFKPFAIVTQKAVRGRDTIYYDDLPNYESLFVGDLRLFIRNKRTLLFSQTDNAEDAPALILNTSGTTGAPKGVVLTNKNILSSEFAFNKAFEINSDDMIAMPSGFYHAIGFHHGLISTIIAGSSMVIMRHYNVKDLVEILKKYPVTLVDSVPTVIYDILFEIEDLGQLRQLISGGDKLKSNLLEKARLRKLPVYNCYGLTEAVPFSYTPKKYFVDSNYTSTAVIPMDGIKIRLLDEQRHEIKLANIKGNIEVSGPVIFKEYLLNSEKTEASVDGKWFITGDFGHYNDDGLLEIDGRNSDKIIRGGENISAKVVEAKIMSCPVVKEVAVLGLPDVRLGQRIGAFIVLKTPDCDFSKTQLNDFLSNNKVDKKLWPERVFLLDQLPKTVNGKVKKYILKEKVKAE